MLYLALGKCDSIRKEPNCLLFSFLLCSSLTFSFLPFLLRLKEHLSPGGRLYVVGMNPIPDSAQGAANIVTEVRRARDSCILLAGHRPYRWPRPLNRLPSHWPSSPFDEPFWSPSFTPTRIQGIPYGLDDKTSRESGFHSQLIQKVSRSALLLFFSLFLTYLLTYLLTYFMLNFLALVFFFFFTIPWNLKPLATV